MLTRMANDLRRREAHDLIVVAATGRAAQVQALVGKGMQHRVAPSQRPDGVEVVDDGDAAVRGLVLPDRRLKACRHTVACTVPPAMHVDPMMHASVPEGTLDCCGHS